MGNIGFTEIFLLLFVLALIGACVAALVAIILGFWRRELAKQAVETFDHAYYRLKTTEDKDLQERYNQIVQQYRNAKGFHKMNSTILWQIKRDLTELISHVSIAKEPPSSNELLKTKM